MSLACAGNYHRLPETPGKQIVHRPANEISKTASRVRHDFNAPLLLLEDVKHSNQESRFHALGKTDQERLLHIAFTLREAGAKIRVISARDMHRKERVIYEQTA